MTGGNIPWLIRSLMLASPAARAKALAPLALSPKARIIMRSTPICASSAARAKALAPLAHPSRTN